MNNEISKSEFLKKREQAITYLSNKEICQKERVLNVLVYIYKLRGKRRFVSLNETKIAETINNLTKTDEFTNEDVKKILEKLESDGFLYIVPKIPSPDIFTYLLNNRRWKKHKELRLAQLGWFDNPYFRLKK